jgi:hypothetical protein
MDMLATSEVLLVSSENKSPLGVLGGASVSGIVGVSCLVRRDLVIFETVEQSYIA